MMNPKSKDKTKGKALGYKPAPKKVEAGKGAEKKSMATPPSSAPKKAVAPASKPAEKKVVSTKKPDPPAKKTVGGSKPPSQSGFGRR